MTIEWSSSSRLHDRPFGPADSGVIRQCCTAVPEEPTGFHRLSGPGQRPGLDQRGVDRSSECPVHAPHQGDGLQVTVRLDQAVAHRDVVPPHRRVHLEASAEHLEGIPPTSLRRQSPSQQLVRLRVTGGQGDASLSFHAGAGDSVHIHRRGGQRQSKGRQSRTKTRWRPIRIDGDHRIGAGDDILVSSGKGVGDDPGEEDLAIRPVSPLEIIREIEGILKSTLNGQIPDILDSLLSIDTKITHLLPVPESALRRLGKGLLQQAGL